MMAKTLKKSLKKIGFGSLQMGGQFVIVPNSVGFGHGAGIRCLIKYLSKKYCIYFVFNILSLRR
jgi:uncharacterized membrane-anchored protein YitT (DUF2179 family)